MLLCMGSVMRYFASTLVKILTVTSQFGGSPPPRSFWADRLGLRYDGRAEEALRINQMISPPATVEVNSMEKANHCLQLTMKAGVDSSF